MIAAKWIDPLIGVDIHIVMIPNIVPFPAPLPHPFVGIVFDPLGLLMGSMMAKLMGSFKGITFINKLPAANTGIEGTNKFILPHLPMPPGFTLVPPIAPNESTLVMGSKTVFTEGTHACRLGDLAMSCAEPVRLPTTTVLALPLGPPVLIGGPPTFDLLATILSAIKTKWVSDKLNGILDKCTFIKNKSWIRKTICFFTGHPVDVSSGMVMTDEIDLELPGPIPFKMERTYYSRSEYNGPLGYGWAHSYDQFIRIEEERIVYHDGDGREIYFDLIDVHEQTRHHAERIDLHRSGSEITLYTHDNLIYRFSECGREDGVLPLTRIDDHNNNAIRLLYDENGFLIRIIDSAGRVIKYVNDSLGRLIAVTVPDPDRAEGTHVVRQYSYSSDGDLATATDAMDHSFTYKYKYHLLVQETNRNGLSFYFSYDGIDHDANCVRTWGDGGIYDHMLTYDKQNGVTLVENSLGEKTTYFADANGIVTRILDARGAETFYEYDEFERKILEKDPLGNETGYEYDELGNTTRVTDPDGTQEQIHYNKYNLPVQAVDKMGGEWTWEYDSRLRITKRTDPLQRKTQFMYTGKFLSGIVNPAGAITGIAIDQQGNLRQVHNPDGSTVSWRYDRLGQCHTTTDPNNNNRSSWFDPNGRVVRVDEPDGNTLELRYDPEGNVIHAKDRHYDVSFSYSGMNKLASRSQNGTQVDFIYDTEEQLTTIRNEHGSAYTFTLDSCGDVIVEAGFDGITREYARDMAGQVVRIDRPADKTSAFTYDPMGRVTKIVHSDDSYESYTYRDDGELVEAANSACTVKLERDILGRITHEWQDDYRVSSEYDQQDNRIRLHSSLGADQQIRRNLMGDVEGISHNNGTTENRSSWETTFLRDKFGLELQREMPGGLSARWQRDRLGRPITHTISTTAGYRRSRTYEWDVNNRLKSIDDTLTGKTLFVHDPFGNLARADIPDGTTLFRMPDTIGNLFRSEDRSDRKYGPAGQLLEAKTKDGTVTYDYDVEGNLITKTEADGSAWHYIWNGAGMLEKVIRPDGEEVLFTYDALGRRISKTYKGRTTRWVWDGNVMLHEWVEYTEAPSTSPDTENDDDSRFIRIHYTGRPSHAPPLSLQGSAEKPITWLFDPESFTPLARMVGDHYHNIITDHLGTPLAMFNELGEKEWSMEMDIYGRVHSMDGKASHCPFRYPGQYEDEEIGLYYNRFRYYDPEGGVYVSQDPIGLAGGNPTLYGYSKEPNFIIDTFGLNTALGNWGEKLASKYLSSIDHQILGAVQNASNQGFDLITKTKDGFINVIEVKTGTYRWYSKSNMRRWTNNNINKIMNNSNGKWGNMSKYQNKLINIIDEARRTGKLKNQLLQINVEERSIRVKCK